MYSHPLQNEEIEVTLTKLETLLLSDSLSIMMAQHPFPFGDNVPRLIEKVGVVLVHFDDLEEETDKIKFYVSKVNSKELPVVFTYGELLLIREFAKAQLIAGSEKTGTELVGYNLLIKSYRGMQKIETRSLVSSVENLVASLAVNIMPSKLISPIMPSIEAPKRKRGRPRKNPNDNAS